MSAVNEGAPQSNVERDAEVYRRRIVECWTQDRIAREYGISQQRVSQIIAERRAALPPVDLEAIRAQALELHEDVIAQAYALAGLRGAPVTAGKDGDVVHDPEDDSVVRDYALRLSALKLALDADERRRKLLGLDAASKTEVSGSVRYEIAGIDVEALK